MTACKTPEQIAETCVRIETGNAELSFPHAVMVGDTCVDRFKYVYDAEDQIELLRKCIARIIRTDRSIFGDAIRDLVDAIREHEQALHEQRAVLRAHPGAYNDPTAPEYAEFVGRVATASGKVSALMMAILSPEESK